MVSRPPAAKSSAGAHFRRLRLVETEPVVFVYIIAYAYFIKMDDFNV